MRKSRQSLAQYLEVRQFKAESEWQRKYPADFIRVPVLLISSQRKHPQVSSRPDLPSLKRSYQLPIIALAALFLVLLPSTISFSKTAEAIPGAAVQERGKENELFNLLDRVAESLKKVILVGEEIRPEQEKKLSSLKITSHPSGAIIYLNGVDQGRTPLTLSSLEVGTYRLRAVKDSQMKEQTVSIKPKKTTSLEFSFAAPMVLIPAGEFLMGSSEGNSDEKPVHKVYLDAYYLDKYEVTNQQYREFVKATGYRAPNQWGEDNHPVVYVTWNDVVAYAKWAGKRLPTEAEWEKAARAGLKEKKYLWGNKDPDGSQCNFADRNTSFSWSDKSANDGYSRTAPVGTYPPNNFGLYDMAGNVWEWCSDWYDKNYYANSLSKNPQGPNNGSYRVVRGGGWVNDARYVRCAFRGYYGPDDRFNDLGFRCAQSP